MHACIYIYTYILYIILYRNIHAIYITTQSHHILEAYRRPKKHIFIYNIDRMSRGGEDSGRKVYFGG